MAPKPHGPLRLLLRAAGLLLSLVFIVPAVFVASPVTAVILLSAALLVAGAAVACVFIDPISPLRLRRSAAESQLALSHEARIPGP